VHQIEAWLRARRGVSEDRSIQTESTGFPSLLDWLQGMASRRAAGKGEKPPTRRPGDSFDTRHRFHPPRPPASRPPRGHVSGSRSHTLAGSQVRALMPDMQGATKGGDDPLRPVAKRSLRAT
jgi:hypothetical protein